MKCKKFNYIMFIDLFNTIILSTIVTFSLLIYFAVGFVTIKILSISSSYIEKNPALLIFLGYGFLLSILSFLNFFFKLNYIFFSIIFSISLLIFIYDNKIKNLLKLNNINIFIYFVLIFLISKISMITYFSSDTGYYHIPLVKIITEQPTVFGLANIFPQYGFNNSNNYISALSMISPFYDRGFSVPSIIIFISVIIYLFQINKDNDDYFFWIVLGAHFFYNFKNIGSITPDFYINCFVIIILCELFFLLKKKKNLIFLNDQIKLILFFLSIIFYIKFSTAFFCLSILLVLLFCFKKKFFSFLSTKFILVLVITSSIFFLKNIALSGYMLYPIDTILINTLWTVSSDVPKEMYNIVVNFARQSSDHSFIIKGTNWIPYWFKNNDIIFISSVFVSFAIFFINILFKTKDFFNSEKNLLILFSFLCLSLFFWFFSAPQIRFSLMLNVFIFLIIIELNLIEVNLIKRILNYSAKPILFLIIFYSVFYLNFINIYININNDSFEYKNGWRKIPKEIIKITSTNEFKDAKVISINGKCWFSELFCRTGSYPKLDKIKIKNTNSRNMIIYRKK